MWLRAAWVDGADTTRGPHFGQSSFALEAAALGRGVALAKATIASADLAAGRVVRMLEMSIPPAFAHYLVYPEATSPWHKVAASRAGLPEPTEPRCTGARWKMPLRGSTTARTALKRT